MALGTITFAQKPSTGPTGVGTTESITVTNWTPVAGYMAYQDNISSLYYFKLIIEVRVGDGSGELLAKLKQKPNGYITDAAAGRARAFFDLKDIINDYVAPTLYDQNDATPPYRSIHTIGANTAAKPLSVSGDRLSAKPQVVEIYVKAYQEYSQAENVSPTEDATENVTDTQFYMQTARYLMKPRNTSTGIIQPPTNMTVWGYALLFLTDQPLGQGFSGDVGLIGWRKRIFVRDGDYHTVAWLNDLTNFSSFSATITIKYYNAAGVQIASAGTETIANNSTNGGCAPSATNTDTKRLIYFGSGPGNLEAQSVNTDLRPSAYPNWAWYKLTLNSSTYGLFFVRNSDISCSKYKVRRLAWRNSYGAWDYFNFTMRNTETVELTRSSYNSLLGELGSDVYTYNDTDRGTSTSKVYAKVKESLQTDWILPDKQLTDSDTGGGGFPIGYSTLMEQLFLSNEVYMIENSDTDTTIPVIVTDKKFIRKTRLTDKMIQYTVNIEHANPLNTNS